MEQPPENAMGILRSDEASYPFHVPLPPAPRSMTDPVRRVHAVGRPVGFGGLASGNEPCFLRLLIEAGIASFSISPDSFLDARREITAAEGIGRS